MPASATPVSIWQSLFCSLFILSATCSGAEAQNYNSWQSMETVMDASDYPLTPDQDFALTRLPVASPAPANPGAAAVSSWWYGHDAPAAAPHFAPATLMSPSGAADAATTFGAAAQGPSQAELQGQAIQNGLMSHRHHNGLSHQQPYSLIYVVGADGKPVSLPYVVPNGAQSTQPVIIIQQSAPTAVVQQAPVAPIGAAPARAAAPEAVPSAASPAAAAPALGDAKQATWKAVVNSLAGNASAVPGNLGKGMSVAAPVLNAILQGL